MFVSFSFFKRIQKQQPKTISYLFPSLLPASMPDLSRHWWQFMFQNLCPPLRKCKNNKRSSKGKPRDHFEPARLLTRPWAAPQSTLSLLWEAVGVAFPGRTGIQLCHRRAFGSCTCACCPQRLAHLSLHLICLFHLLGPLCDPADQCPTGWPR